MGTEGVSTSWYDVSRSWQQSEAAQRGGLGSSRRGGARPLTDGTAAGGWGQAGIGVLGAEGCCGGSEEWLTVRVMADARSECRISQCRVRHSEKQH